MAVELQIETVIEFGLVAAVIFSPLGNESIREVSLDVGLYGLGNQRGGHLRPFAIHFQQLARLVELDGATIIEANFVLVVKQLFI